MANAGADDGLSSRNFESASRAGPYAPESYCREPRYHQASGYRESVSVICLYSWSARGASFTSRAAVALLIKSSILGGAWENEMEFNTRTARMNAQKAAAGNGLDLLEARPQYF